jgi:hypothetical protein
MNQTKDAPKTKPATRIKASVELTNLLVQIVGELYNKHNLPGSSPGYVGVHQPVTFYDSGRFKPDPLPPDIGIRSEFMPGREKEAAAAMDKVLRMNADRDRAAFGDAFVREAAEKLMRKRIDSGLTTQHKGEEIEIGETEIEVSESGDPPRLVISLDLQKLLDLGVRASERRSKSGWGRA